MNKTILFGREVQGANTTIIAKPDISAQHAKITYLGNNQFEVEDLGSSNGTYVNGYRVRKTTVSIDDQVRLSSGVVIDLAKEFGLGNGAIQKTPKNNPKDYSDEFARLKLIYEKYKKDRKKIIIGHNNKMAGIRTGITLAPLPLIFIFRDNPVYSAFTLIGAGVANFITGNMTNMDKIEALDEQFRLQYVCPNRDCNLPLGHNNSWNLIHENPGKCFKCGAIYNKNKL